MMRTDLLVVGSGAGGLSSAITAAILGCKVILVEKSPWLGGTMAWSGGGIWVPANPHMQATDAKDKAIHYMRALIGHHFDEEMVSAFLDAAPEMVRFLEANTTTCRFYAADFMPDYEPDIAGAVYGRTMSMPHVDAADIGPVFARLRPPLRQLTAFGGMQIDGADLDPLIQRWETIAGFRHATKLVSRHAIDWLRSRRGRVLKGGNAVAARMLRAAVDAGVTLLTDAPAVRLIEKGGQVVGSVVRINGRETEIRADRGVVMATGGFANDPAMRERYMPFAHHHLSMLPEDNAGDGLRMATEIGARLGESLPNNGIWCPISVLRKSNDAAIPYPHIFLDRSRPGSIIVDRTGRRFVNEATHYQAMVSRMHETGAVPCWLLAGHRFVKRYGLGLVRPFERIKPYIDAGYVRKGATIKALSQAIGIDSAALAATFAKVDADAAQHRDSAFGRGESVYDRLYGDATRGPNTNFGAMGDGPYHALEIVPGDLGTSVGLVADTSSRVLRDGAAIPGLYVAGLDMQSMTGGGISRRWRHAWPCDDIWFHSGHACLWAESAPRCAGRMRRTAAPQRFPFAAWPGLSTKFAGMTFARGTPGCAFGMKTNWDRCNYERRSRPV